MTEAEVSDAAVAAAGMQYGSLNFGWSFVV